MVRFFDGENMVYTMDGMNELFRRLNNLHRWSFLITESGRNELAKQALNSAYTYLLASEYEARTGEKLEWSKFPKIAIYRAFQKAYVNFDIKDETLHAIEGSENSQDLFDNVTKDIIRREMGEDFHNWIITGCGSFEERLYKAATKIATIVELTEIRQKINGHFAKPYTELIESAKKYGDIPGFLDFMKDPDENERDGKKYPIDGLRDISRLRNHDRWSVYSYATKCSVLGHLFDTGVIAYLVGLEHGYSEEEATKDFFLGIFHDLAETYTGDIPSPIKDSIDGFRTKSELYELKEISKYFLPCFSPEVQQAIKEVMFEDEINHNRKNLIKVADYMSAISEIWRQAIKGCRDKELYKALISHEAKLLWYGASKAEMQVYTSIEQYARKKMLISEAQYFMALIEMKYCDFWQLLKHDEKKAKAFEYYQLILAYGEKLKETGGDAFEMGKYYRIESICRNELGI